MTETELETAIRAHEMQRLELKESFGAECIETACAFANAQGGRIVLGVDNKGDLARLPLRFEALRDYENRIATATEPSVAVDAFYDMHLIEHYGSGIRRIKDECAKNGNKPPAWSQNYGSFITVYESRLERDSINDAINSAQGTTNEVVNASHEVGNGPHEVGNEVGNPETDPITPRPVSGREGINEGINEADNKPDNKPDNNRTLDNIIVEVVRRSPGINRAEVAKFVGKSVVAEAVARLKAIGAIEHRGSKKTGGYYAVKQGG